MPLIISQARSQAEARRLQRAAAARKLRRLYAGVYTDDLKSPLEALTRRELYALLAAIAPRRRDQPPIRTRVRSH